MAVDSFWWGGGKVVFEALLKKRIEGRFKNLSLSLSLILRQIRREEEAEEDSQDKIRYLIISIS